MFVLGDDEKWRREKPPIEMLQAFEKCLKKTFGADQIESCRRAVTVIFEKNYYPDDHEGKVLSIDAVPAFEAGKDVYEIPDKVTGTWIKTNPEKHMEQATEKNEDSMDVGFRSSKWQRAGTGQTASRSSRLSWSKSWRKGWSKLRSQPTRMKCGTYSPRWRQMSASSWPDPAGLGPPVSDQMTPELVTAARKALQEAQRKAALACAPKRQDGRAKRCESGARCWATTFLCRSGPQNNLLRAKRPCGSK